MGFRAPRENDFRLETGGNCLGSSILGIFARRHSAISLQVKPVVEKTKLYDKKYQMVLVFKILVYEVPAETRGKNVNCDPAHQRQTWNFSKEEIKVPHEIEILKKRNRTGSNL